MIISDAAQFPQPRRGVLFVVPSTRNKPEPRRGDTMKHAVPTGLEWYRLIHFYKHSAPPELMKLEKTYSFADT
jgi:hypothetical protein